MLCNTLWSDRRRLITKNISCLFAYFSTLPLIQTFHKKSLFFGFIQREISLSAEDIFSLATLSAIIYHIRYIIGAMDIEVTPAAPGKSHWTYFAICTTVVKVMVTSIVFSLLFIAPSYQIYINYLLNVNN